LYYIFVTIFYEKAVPDTPGGSQGSFGLKANFILVENPPALFNLLTENRW